MGSEVCIRDSGIADGACDCDGNTEDCAGECGGDAVVDECGECGGDGSSCAPVLIGFGAVGDVLMEITMDTPHDVGGFQFDVLGTTLGQASGGLAAEAGFTVSTGGSTILGFSFTGSVIPAGSSGVLTNVEYTATNTEACLDLGTGAISDANGQALEVEFGDCTALDFDIVGCTDSEACNYNEDANEDDGSCEYPEENYDCDGNCTVEVDACGECGGDGSSCTVSLSFGVVLCAT